MMKSLLLGTILGGLVASVWSSICWEVLRWHEKPLHIFQNEDEVAGSIASHATQSGIYLLPVGPSQEGMTAEQKKVARAVLMEKMRKGPIMFAAIRRGGFGSYARGLMIQLLSLMVPAFLLIRLLFQTSGLSYRRRVLFLAVAGLAASVIVDLPNWNWPGFSGVFTAVNLADFTLMWLFAGLVVAKVAKPQVGQSGLWPASPVFAGGMPRHARKPCVHLLDIRLSAGCLSMNPVSSHSELRSIALHNGPQHHHGNRSRFTRHC